MSKIVQFAEFGGPEVLRLIDIDLGQPKAYEVKLDVKAIGLNRADALLRQNHYIETPPLPSRLGYDAAAEVIAIGPEVTNVSIGDRVMTIPTFSQAKYGVYGEQAIIPENACWPWPISLPAESAACVGVQYTTVYFAFQNVAHIKPGDAILLTAATGGVGIAGIQVAKEMGATVIATTRKQDKAKALADTGADHVVITDEENLAERVKSITAGKGVKMVFDPIAGMMIPTLLDCLATGGKCVVYGIMDMNAPLVPMLPILMKNLSLSGYSVFAFTGFPSMGMPQQTEAVEAAKAFLVPRLADGRLKPLVSEMFEIGQVIDAHRSLESNKQIGKIVLLV
jgi:NADPH:quinone reductase